MSDLTPFKGGNSIFLSFLGELAKNIFGSVNDFMPGLGTNIIDLGDKYIMEVDVNGFNEDEVHIIVSDDTLTINARHDIKFDYNDGNFFQAKRQFGSITRNFNISDVKANEINVDYKNSKLIIDMPKKYPRNKPIIY